MCVCVCARAKIIFTFKEIKFSLNFPYAAMLFSTLIHMNLATFIQTISKSYFKNVKIQSHLIIIIYYFSSLVVFLLFEMFFSL